MIKLRDVASRLYEKADADLATVTPEEAMAWINHPITTALMATLKGDYENLITAWTEGDFTTESLDGSLQKNANAIGKVQSITEIFAWIENLRRNPE
jgi:hypothetical protein